MLFNGDDVGLSFVHFQLCVVVLWEMHFTMIFFAWLVPTNNIFIKNKSSEMLKLGSGFGQLSMYIACYTLLSLENK